MKQNRKKPEVRKAEALKIALQLAADRGYANITRDEVAAEMGVCGSSVQYYFGTMSQFRVELMRYAVKQRNARVVAQGLAVYDRHALKADEALRRAAVESLSGKGNGA